MANKKVSQLTSKPSVLVTDLFPIADPSTGQLYKTTISDLGTAIGSGVSSVNGLVGAVVLDTDDIQELVSPTNKWFTDTRARAALSASSPLTYNSGTGAFGIQVANGLQNGYLSSADWTTFNAKQAALSGTGFVKISGTTISYDNSTYLTTSAAASTYLALGGGTMTGVLFGASASFSGFVGFGGNTSPLAAIDVTGAGKFSSSVTASALYVNGMTAGSGAIYHTGSRLTFANYNASGTLHFEVNGGTGALTLNSDTSASFVSTISATGATLTGALSGTSATFTNNSNVNNIISASSLTSGAGIQIDNSGRASGGKFSILVGNVANGTFSIKDEINNFTPLQIASTGAATFSSSVSATSTTATGGFMEIQGSANAIKTFYLNRYGVASGSQHRLRAENGYLEIASANSENIVLTGGNVGIGTTSPFQTDTNRTVLSVNGTTNAIINLGSGGTLRSYIYADGGGGTYETIGTNTISASGANIINFLTNGSERMRITSGGEILVNMTGITTTGVGTMLSQGSTYANIRLFGTGTQTYTQFFSSGTATGSITGTAVLVSYNTTSDYRLKEDLKPINGLDLVNKIKVYDYKWKADNSRMDGVLAHELAEVLPYAVQGVKDGEQMQQVDYSKIVPVMVQAIKDLKAKIEILENK